MSKFSDLILTCRFSDFVQAYCGPDWKLEEKRSYINDCLLTAENKSCQFTEEQFNEILDCFCEIKVTNQLSNCDELTVSIIKTSGQCTEYICDCIDAARILIDIIRASTPYELTDY